MCSYIHIQCQFAFWWYFTTWPDMGDFFTQYTRMVWLYKYTCGLFKLNMHTTLHTHRKFRPHGHKNLVHVWYDPWECESVYGFLNIEYAYDFTYTLHILIPQPQYAFSVTCECIVQAYSNTHLNFPVKLQAYSLKFRTYAIVSNCGCSHSFEWPMF